MTRPARWVALLVVVVLGGGSVAMLSSGFAAESSVSLPSIAPAMSSTTAGSTRITIPTTLPSTTEHPIPADPLEVLQGGLTAWGYFAISGDLESVAPWFHSDGPQWAQFVQEATALAADPIGPPPYTVTMEQVRPRTRRQAMTVSARVVFVRPGESSQSFRWVISLRRHDHRWWIWTVTTSP